MNASEALLTYWRGLYFCLVKGAHYSALRATLPSLEPAAGLQIYWLALHVRLWSKPHYRSGTFANDARKNLRNVALPGTGVPLSLLFYVWPLCVLFLWLGVPLAALAAAIIGRVHRGAALGAAFSEALLTPRDWFSYWRLNCVLASYHALKTSDAGYALEDKLTFMQACEAEGVAVSPWLRHKKIVVKHRNEEGGLGMNTFLNADAGGDWIVQGWLANAEPIARLLPREAPLSTLRFITASKACVRARPAAGCDDDDILVLSACFRAGREGASTDHSCIMFDVDLPANKLKKGTSNSHWYQLGRKALSAAWFSAGHTVTHHPDSATPIAGESLPGLAESIELVRRAHRKLMPGVPLVGWDVAMTDPEGILLLEANLSCNFFRATFDEAAYCSFAESVLHFLEKLP